MEAGLFDLFASLGASEEQLDFTVLYASAREVRRSVSHSQMLSNLQYRCAASHAHHVGDAEQRMQMAACHTVAPQGWASTELPESKERPEGASLAPLLDAITRLVPAPTGLLDADTKVRSLLPAASWDAWCGKTDSAVPDEGMQYVSQTCCSSGKVMLNFVPQGDMC